MAPAGEPLTARDAPSGQRTPGWQQLLTAVAAAAGGAAWVSAVGSAIVGLRLENADLPIEPTVALMSAEHRFAIGAGYLIAPLFVGFLGFIVDWIVSRHRATGRAKPGKLERLLDRIERFDRALVAAVTIGVGAALGVLLLRPPLVWLFLVQCVAMWVVVAAIHLYTVRRQRADPKRGAQEGLDADPESGAHDGLNERVVVFVAVLVVTGVIALIVEGSRTPAFDVAEIQLKNGELVTGAYVTTTPNAAVVITPRRDGCPSIGAVPREQIERIWIGPSSLKVDIPKRCTVQRPL